MIWVEILVNKFRIVLCGAAFATALLLSGPQASAMILDITVSKISQHMTVEVDGKKIYDWLVSTGGDGYDTPSGTYHPFRMEKEHFSKEWDDAPMPYSMFFTPQGHALHGSYHIKSLGQRASHGCVRIAPENAALLFALMQKAGYRNSTIHINGGFFDMSRTPHTPFHFFWEKPAVAEKVAQVETKPLLKKKIKHKKLQPIVVQ